MFSTLVSQRSDQSSLLARRELGKNKHIRLRMKRNILLCTCINCIYFVGRDHCSFTSIKTLMAFQYLSDLFLTVIKEVINPYILHSQIIMVKSAIIKKCQFQFYTLYSFLFITPRFFHSLLRNSFLYSLIAFRWCMNYQGQAMSKLCCLLQG